MVPGNPNAIMKTRQLFIDVVKRTTAALTATAMFVGPAGVTLANPPNHERQNSEHAVQRLQNIIVIYQENWSFDSLYGSFPGANGISKAGKSVRQVSREGKDFVVLPQPRDTRLRPIAPDPRFPADLPVEPFDLSKYVKADDQTGDLIHRFYQEQ